jgi:hypothetical protein
MPAPGIHGWREHDSPPHFFKDISEKDLVTMAGRLGGCRYNRFSLQVESVYSDYLRVAILGNEMNTTHTTMSRFSISFPVGTLNERLRGDIILLE